MGHNLVEGAAVYPDELGIEAKANGRFYQYLFPQGAADAAEVPAQAAGGVVGLLAKEGLQGGATGRLIGSGQIGQEGTAFTAELGDGVLVLVVVVVNGR